MIRVKIEVIYNCYVRMYANLVILHNNYYESHGTNSPTW